VPVRPDAIIIADHALARRRAALRSLADFATATDRRLNGPRQVCCRINRAVFDSAEPARNAGPRLVCALCRADRAGGRDMTFSENGVRPRCGWQQNKNRQRGGVPNGGFIVALLANTVTGDAARRKRVAFHAAVCDSDRARQPLFPRSDAAARPYGTLGNTSHCRWDRPPRRAAVRNRRSAETSKRASSLPLATPTDHWRSTPPNCLGRFRRCPTTPPATCHGTIRNPSATALVQWNTWLQRPI
jgi:hypothetical protein